ncbi:MAG: hypothetical protein M1587_01840 [Thaumarchaeota archaeon]|nr:hypothetical protein [Nitrososphaerota archaeon]
MDKLNLGEMTQEEFQKFLRDKVQEKTETKEVSHKDIQPSQIADYLTRGYKFIANFTDETGKPHAIVELPTLGVRH